MHALVFCPGYLLIFGSSEHGMDVDAFFLALDRYEIQRQREESILDMLVGIVTYDHGNVVGLALPL